MTKRVKPDRSITPRTAIVNEERRYWFIQNGEEKEVTAFDYSHEMGLRDQESCERDWQRQGLSLPCLYWN